MSAPVSPRRWLGALALAGSLAAAACGDGGTQPSTGGFTLSATPATIAASIGGSLQTAIIGVSRAGGFTGPVTLVVSGAPAGMTATVSPGSAAGNAATLSVQAGTTVAAGSYPLVVRGTASGVAAQQATVTVTVAAGPNNQVTIPFCAGDAPSWVAVQDGAGAWTRVQGTSGSFTFTLASGRGGLATVYENGPAESAVSVLYASASELNQLSALSSQFCDLGVGGKRVTGTVTNLAASQAAVVSMDVFASDFVEGGTGARAFELDGIRPGARDLVAVRGTESSAFFTLVPDRVVVRRALDPANGSALPAIDFGGAEAVAPVTGTVTVTGLGADTASVDGYLQTANGTFATLGADVVTPGDATAAYFGLAAAQLLASDQQELSVFAFERNGGAGIREAGSYFRAAGARTLALGPALATPVVSDAATTPSLRPRLQLARQAEYDRLADVQFEQHTSASASRSFYVTMTSGYAGAAATAWDLVVPDLSGAQGWTAAWGLQAGVPYEWYVSAAGGFTYGFDGTQPADGATYRRASTSTTSSVGSPNAALSARGALVERRTVGSRRVPRAGRARR